MSKPQSNTVTAQKRPRRKKKKKQSANYERLSLSQRTVERNVLRHLILKHDFSIFAAATKINIEEERARRLLFDKKPEKKQIAYALEIYDKGLPLLTACVASGVSFQQINEELAERDKTRNRPYRW